MKRTAAFLIFASVLLQGCGWDSKTRLVPTYEREVIALSGTYDVGEDSVSFSPFSNEGLQTVIIETGSGSRYTNRVAYDLVQVKGTIEEGVDRREFTYLAERRQIPQEEPNLTYDLITVRKVHGENDEFTGNYEFKQYSLECADATRRINTNTEGSACTFNRYNELMTATTDVLQWMSDPRIAIEYDTGYKR